MGGFKTFGAEVLTASDVNDYLMRQAVITVASVAARDAIASPSEGMHVYVTADSTLYEYGPSGWRSAFSDTGWQAPTLSAGWTNVVTPQWRNINGTVYWRGTVSRAMTSGTILELVASDAAPGVSELGRPAGSYRNSIAPMSHYNGSSAVLSCGTDGKVTIRPLSTATFEVHLGTWSYRNN